LKIAYAENTVVAQKIVNSDGCQQKISPQKTHYSDPFDAVRADRIFLAWPKIAYSSSSISTARPAFRCALIEIPLRSVRLSSRRQNAAASRYSSSLPQRSRSRIHSSLSFTGARDARSLAPTQGLENQRSSVRNLYGPVFGVDFRGQKSAKSLGIPPTPGL